MKSWAARCWLGCVLAVGLVSCRNTPAEAPSALPAPHAPPPLLTPPPMQAKTGTATTAPAETSTTAPVETPKDTSIAAPTTAPSTTTPPSFGQIKAYYLVGDFKLIHPDGSNVKLKQGDLFGEGETVMVGPDSTGLLVFVNGKTIRMTPNLLLKVVKYQQGKIDETKQQSFEKAFDDKSESVTVLELLNGTMQTSAGKFNDSDSSFTINTPGGHFELHGGLKSISVVRNAAGEVTSELGNSIMGDMLFKPKDFKNPGNASDAATNPGYLIPTGAQMQIALQINSIGQITDVNVAGAGLPVEASRQIIQENWDAGINARPPSYGPGPPPRPPPPAAGLPTDSVLPIEPTILPMPEPTPPPPALVTPSPPPPAPPIKPQQIPVSGARFYPP